MLVNNFNTPNKEPDMVKKFFNKLVPFYDFLNIVMSLGQERIWRKKITNAVEKAAQEISSQKKQPFNQIKVLDVACGTGTSTKYIKNKGLKVTGIDFSPKMLSIAKKNIKGVKFIEGDATSMPFNKGEFDIVTISVAIRNFKDTKQILKEMARVTKPGGKIVLAEFSTPTWTPFKKLYIFYIKNILPIVPSVITKNNSPFTYFIKTLQSWPSQEELAQIIYKTGWEQVKYKNLTGGIVAIHKATRRK